MFSIQSKVHTKSKKVSNPRLDDQTSLIKSSNLVLENLPE